MIKVCPVCEESFNADRSRQILCSFRCAAEKRSGRLKNVPQASCAVCLFSIGLGLKSVSRLTGLNKVNLSRFRTQRGIPKSKRPAINLRYTINGTRSRIQRMKLWAFKSDQKGFTIGDESSHWINHQEVLRFMALRRYYENHEEEKARARLYTKERYHSDSDYREKKRSIRQVSIDSIDAKYARMKLSQGTILKPSEFPEEIVELKRLHLKLKRKTKELWQSKT